MWCNLCKILLSFDLTVQRLQKGLSNIYSIKCSQCAVVKQVYTNDVFDDDRSLFTINAKAAAGTVDAGIGETQLNALLTSMNIEPVSSSLLKRYERKVGKCIEKAAIESCSQSLEEEISLTENANDIVLDNNVPGMSGLTFSFDAGWQKRGTGRSYNSLSGHGVLMGHYSKKICSFATRSKNCRRCLLGHKQEDHDCRRNYDGSAKGMEADMAVMLYTKNPLFEKHKVFGARLVMDNDCSTIASLRKVSKHSIELWADKNHSVKTFTSSLWNISLPRGIIEYFCSTFGGVIEEHKGNPDDLRDKLKSLVPHASATIVCALFIKKRRTMFTSDCRKKIR
uniref:Mutator-like transposase domain-containing protein n=1 Tax=Trichogramma kaykai TaxID=54128 RepID=A0ABD2X077_9HYME